jgi:hypothetical protein
LLFSFGRFAQEQADGNTAEYEIVAGQSRPVSLIKPDSAYDTVGLHGTALFGSGWGDVRGIPSLLSSISLTNRPFTHVSAAPGWRRRACGQ